MGAALMTVGFDVLLALAALLVVWLLPEMEKRA